MDQQVQIEAAKRCDKCQRERKSLYPYSGGNWCGTCISREERRINTREMYGRGRKGY